MILSKRDGGGGFCFRDILLKSIAFRNSKDYYIESLTEYFESTILSPTPHKKRKKNGGIEQTGLINPIYVDPAVPS